jgi:hypothetical protein
MILLSSFDINNIILFLGDSDEKFSHGSWTLKEYTMDKAKRQ